MKIRKWLNNLRVFKRIKDLVVLNERLRSDNDQLKGQLMNRRKTIKEQSDNIIKIVMDLDKVSKELEKVKIKKKKGEVGYGQLVRRRDEFLKRIGVPVPDASISTFSDYKYWLSEPFIVDSYKSYEMDKDAIDGVSAIKGLGKIFEKTDEKKDEFILP